MDLSENLFTPPGVVACSLFIYWTWNSERDPYTAGAERLVKVFSEIFLFIYYVRGIKKSLFVLKRTTEFPDNAIV